MTGSFKLFGSAVLAVSAMVISAAAPVQAQSPQGGNICLNVTEIQNTQPTSRRTIEFRMRDGKVWRNDLISDCPDLVFHSAGGFTQVAHTDFICANSQHIKTQSGMVCRLGEFTRVR
jgi:hypothetical protein